MFQVLKCRADDVDGLEEWLKGAKYLSHDIVNELVEIMACAHNLLCKFLVEIRESKWFAIIADETRDASGLEQMCVSIRWVDKAYVVYEDIISIVEVQETDALIISTVLKDALVCLFPSTSAMSWSSL